MIRYSNFILHMQGEPISIWRWTELPMRVPFFWLQTPSYTTANLHTSLFTVSNFNWYPLWRNYLCWYKYFFKKKEKKGKKRTQKRKITEAVLLEISLCMILGVRRDSEREVLDTHHILLHNIAGVSWTLLTYSLCLFFFKLQVFALLSSLLPSDSAASPTADLRLLSALPAPSHLAGCRRHHARHPTGHSSVRSQQDLKGEESIIQAAHWNFPVNAFPLNNYQLTLKCPITLTCLCCCSCCCSSCSLSVSNTTGSTRIMKEVVPTQSAEREKL